MFIYRYLYLFLLLAILFILKTKEVTDVIVFCKAENKDGAIILCKPLFQSFAQQYLKKCWKQHVDCGILNTAR